MKYGFLQYFFTVFCTSFTIVAVLLSVLSFLMGIPDPLGATENLLLLVMCFVIGILISIIARSNPSRIWVFWVLAYISCIGTVLGIGIGSGWMAVDADLPFVVLVASAVFAGTAATVYLRQVHEAVTINKRLEELKQRGERNQREKLIEQEDEQ